MVDANEIPAVGDDIMKMHDEFYSNGAAVDTGDPLADIALTPQMAVVDDNVAVPGAIPVDDGVIELPNDGQAVEEEDEQDEVEVEEGEDRFAALEAKLKAQEDRMADQAGDRAGLTRKNEILEEMLQKMQGGLGKVEPEVEPEEEDPYAEVFKEMEGEFPEMAKPVRKVTKGLMSEVKALKIELQGMKELVAKVTGTVGNLEFSTGVSRTHKDYVEVAKSDKFVSYVKGLPAGFQKYVMNIIKTGTSDEFTEVLDGFKSTQPAADKTSSKVADAAKQASVKVKGVKTKIPKTGSQVINTSNYDTMVKTDADYDKYQKDIMASIAAGTFYV
jgi:hypothetical protein